MLKNFPELQATWPTPNYVDPVTRGIALDVVNGLFLIPSFIVVGLRIYTRAFKVRCFGCDDALISVALIPAIGLCISVIMLDSQVRWNRHIWDVPVDLVSLGYKLIMAIEINFEVAMSLIKLSVLCLYHRVFRKSHYRWFRYVNSGLMVYVIIHGLGACATILFQCSPISAYWTLSSPPNSRCRNENLHAIVLSIINTVGELGVTIVPLPLVWRLKLTRAQRMITTGLFCIAGLVCTVGIARCILVSKIIGKTNDPPWDSWPLWMITAVEVYVALILVSIPGLKPLFSSSNRRRSWPQDRENYTNDRVSPRSMYYSDRRNRITASESYYGSNGDELESRIHPSHEGGSNGILKTVDMIVETSTVDDKATYKR